MAFTARGDHVLLTIISPQEFYLPIRYLASLSNPRQSVLDHVSSGILLHQPSSNLLDQKLLKISCLLVSKASRIILDIPTGTWSKPSIRPRYASSVNSLSGMPIKRPFLMSG